MPEPFVVEIAVQAGSTSGVIQALRQVATEFETSKDNALKATGGASDSLRKIKEHTEKAIPLFKQITANFTGLTRITGIAALGAGAAVGATAMIATSLHHMSTASVNLHYAAREMGMAPKEFLKLRQGLQMLGLGMDEAGNSISTFADKIRDAAARTNPFATQLGQDFANFGEQGKELVRQMVATYRQTGSTAASAMVLAEAMRHADPSVVRYMAKWSGMPEAFADFYKTLPYLKDEMVLGFEAAFQYNVMWVQLSTSLHNFGTQLGVAIIPKLNELYKKLEERGYFGDFNKAIQDISADNMIVVIEDLGRQIKEFFKIIEEADRIGKKIQSGGNLGAKTREFFGIPEWGPAARAWLKKQFGIEAEAAVPQGGAVTQQMQEMDRAKKRGHTTLQDIVDLLSQQEQIDAAEYPGGGGGGWRQRLGIGRYGGGGGRGIEGREVGTRGVDPGLAGAVKAGGDRWLAAHPGWSYKIISGYRAGGGGYHPRGGAIDIAIYDENGKFVKNLGFGPGTREYQVYNDFSMYVAAEAQKRDVPYTWGGHFWHTWMGVPYDIMHQQRGGPSRFHFTEQERVEIASRAQGRGGSGRTAVAAAPVGNRLFDPTPIESRQEGGPVYPGRVYKVGERGTELFSPNVAGQITPADVLMTHQLRGLAEQSIERYADRGRSLMDWWSQQRGPNPPDIGALLEPLGKELINKLTPSLPVPIDNETIGNVIGSVGSSVGYSLFNRFVNSRAFDAFLSREMRKPKIMMNLNVEAPPETNVEASGEGIFGNDNIRTSRNIKRDLETYG